MRAIEHHGKNEIDDIRKLYGGTQGGIFRQSTREKMAAKEDIWRAREAKSTFWYRQRENVKTTLLDLKLFVEVAGKKNVNLVITRESLRPIIEALLWRPIVSHAEPDVNLAEISQLLIEVGFNYLHGMFQDAERDIPLSSKRTLEEAIDLSTHLVAECKSLKEAFKNRKRRLAALVSEEPPHKSETEGNEQ